MFADTRYLVKFYGFTSEDAKAFSRDLAKILGIPPERARELLEEAPVVLREAVDRHEAESLADKLRAIQALCIVEPVSRDEYDEPPAPVLPEAKLPEPASEFSEAQELRYRIWLGIVIAVAVIVVVFGVSAYLVSYYRLYRVPDKPVQLPSATPGVQVQSAEGQPVESVHQLKDRIDLLEEELKDLITGLRLMEDEVIRDSKSLAVDPIQLRGQKQVLYGKQMEVAQLQRQLRELRFRLAEIERAESRDR